MSTATATRKKPVHHNKKFIAAPPVSFPAIAIPEDDLILTGEEAAALCRMPTRWIFEQSRTRAQRGVNPLPVRKPGKYLRFSRNALLKWLESTTVNLSSVNRAPAKSKPDFKQREEIRKCL